VTDSLSPAQAAQYISLEKVKFTGTLYYAEDGTLQRTVDPDQPRYVGKPSPEIGKSNQSRLLFAKPIYHRSAAQYSLSTEAQLLTILKMPTGRILSEIATSPSEVTTHRFPQASASRPFTTPLEAACT